MIPHAFKSRDDVVKHLTGDAHGWEDPGQPYKKSQLVDTYGRPFIPATEYLAIHRELHALDPAYIISDEQRMDSRQW